MDPKVLWVESGSVSLRDTKDWSSTPIYHSRPYKQRWLGKLRSSLHLVELSTVLHARLAEKNCDVVWAGSENIGILLSLIGTKKPLIVIAHHMSSPRKARFSRFAGVVKKWSGIGFISEEGRKFFVDYFQVEPSRLFQYESAKYLDKVKLSDVTYNGPILSVGVAKRDYQTLLAALVDLPGYETELFISSKFGDQLEKQINIAIPEWVHIMGWTSEEELLRHYRETRFVVVPLEKTTHSGAGLNGVVEASTFYKAVIATNSGGMATFVKDGVTGILVPPNSAEAMRAAIQLLAAKPELAEEMGQAGRQYMEDYFNPKKVDAGISAFIRKLANDKQKAEVTDRDALK